jgi:PAP2 superfamily
MLKIELSWQAAAVTSACLFGVTAAIRLSGAARPGSAAHDDAAPEPGTGTEHAAAAETTAGPGPAAGLELDDDPGPAAVPEAAGPPWRARLAGAAAITRETGVVVGLFALWQLAGRYAPRVQGGALARARWIWHAERVARLPSEAAVQRFFLPRSLIVQAFDLYYASLHFVGLIALLAWLFLRHRDRYPEVRAILVMLTGTCLLIQLIPVAPPRMLPLAGMVDTGVLYGQSVYGQIAGFNPAEVSAMPSVHVAWALLVGVTVVRVSASRWRWLALAYPAATTLAVVVTANHFWADGIVAGALLALAMVAYRAGRAARRALASRLRPQPAGSRTPPAVAAGSGYAHVPAQGLHDDD